MREPAGGPGAVEIRASRPPPEAAPGDEEARIATEFRRRRRFLVPFFLIPLLVAVALVSLGMDLFREALLGVQGFTWALGGFALLGLSSLYLRHASRCPSCRRPFTAALLQGQEGRRCPGCGVRLT